MNKSTIISIIIPVYNEEKSLEKLFKELLDSMSPFLDWEVIFINDGSNDGSEMILEKLSKSHQNIKLISFYKNLLSVLECYLNFHLFLAKYLLFLFLKFA